MSSIDFAEVVEFLEPCQLADVERLEGKGWAVCSVQWAAPEMRRGCVVVVLQRLYEGVVQRHYSYPWGVIMKGRCKRKGVPVDQAS